MRIVEGHLEDDNKDAQEDLLESGEQFEPRRPQFAREISENGESYRLQLAVSCTLIF